MHTARLFWFLLLLTACSTRQHASVVEGEVVLPLQHDFYYMVRGQVRSGARGTFIIDTGSQETLVMTYWALRHGVAMQPVKGSFRIHLWGGIEDRVQELARLEELRFGKALISTHLAPVLDLPLPAAGILGMDVMARWAVLYDAAKGEVRILDATEIRARLAVLYPGVHWQKLPMPLIRGRPHLDLQVGNEGPLRFLVDTGSSRSTLPQSLAASLQLKGLPSRPRGRIPDSVAVQIREMRRRSRELGLDPNDLGVVWQRKPPARFLIEALHLGQRTFRLQVEILEREGGLLGWDLLQRFPFVVDAPSERFWLPVSGTGPEKQPDTTPR